MNEITTLKEQRKAGWILASISSMLSLSVIYWYVTNPKKIY
ncbi:hypothetical protein OL548_21530 [Lysinibacillus sp. MHQ-1]|nr:hypothetical protein OL548_21530 [Lysinibacillus sp. MHQ-1]